MEMVVLAVLLTGGILTAIGLSFCAGALVGFLYYRHYNDGAEQTGARTKPLFRQCFSSLFLWLARRLFGYEVKFHGNLASTERDGRPVIYASHPHGVFPLGTLALLASIPALRPCVHRLVFAVPVARELALWFGCVDVSRECIAAQIKTRPVLIVPGGCREMIRERAVVFDQNTTLRLRIEAGDRLMKHALLLAAAVVLLLPLLVALDQWRVFWLSCSALLCAAAAELAQYVYQCATPDSGAYVIQDKHRGFLRLAFESKTPVVLVLQQGQENILVSYSLPRLDLLRTWFMERTGYPLPSLFLGPLPRKLTTHVYEPLEPSNYETAEAFADEYYKRARERYAKLCETM